MKITLNLIVSLVLATTIVVSIFTFYEVRQEKERLSRELEIRAAILAESLEGSANVLLKIDSPSLFKNQIQRFINYDSSLVVALYDNKGNSLVSTNFNLSNLPDSVTHIRESINLRKRISGLTSAEGKSIHFFVAPLNYQNKILGAAMIIHDESNINASINNIWQTNFIHLLTQILLIVFSTILVVRLNIVKPITIVVGWMKNMRTGKAGHQIKMPSIDLFKSLTDEAALMANSLAAARTSAEVEARLRLESESIWTAERLKEYVRKEVGSKNLIVVSNREPYMHVKQGSNIECIIPPGGLVTAIDPILKACGGIWIAHGSGSADVETSNGIGKISVPPEEPSYVLRRIFLSKEEEEGYYYGFSNEGIWPLCHITHTRPTFRLEDWAQYQTVNQKFAEAVLDEIKNETKPLVLIQDYHFALLPALIKSKRPDAHVALFWHIPWPNPEVFGICPWQKEILLGLLGADLIGFHIQFHCNNFLESVDRFLESKINWDQFQVEKGGGITSVKPFPISIDHGESKLHEKKLNRSKNELKEMVYKHTGCSSRFIGVGVDRIDYTKGIVERFNAVERFFEKYPEFVGQFTFVELGAPSRTHIKRYNELLNELDDTVEKINIRYQNKNWKPIIFLKAQHNHSMINLFYKASDLCMVTSLHDGMNLVAKEFISSRDDEDGVLILSQFTGAARELIDALIINPYSIEEVADALFTALNMKQKERTERIRRMRSLLREKNVYRWAANIIADLAHLQVSAVAVETGL
ncbi:MAG: trehalose-6-phosphate synthase [Melioribacter sp.]|nr:trehalose-6-phosphate synthase [Melioribacter sp.]